MKTILLSVLLGVGGLSADTLVLRDGTQVNGTMLNADSRNLSFIDSDGRRREYSITKVKEVKFGDTEFSSRARTEEADMPTGTTVDLVTRLTNNIGQVSDRAQLSPRQKTMLEDAVNVLGRAGHDMREDLSLTNRREVQTALDNVRYVMNSTAIRPADKRMVLDDIAQLRAKYPEFAGKAPRSSSRDR